MELGLVSFADATTNPATGQTISQGERLRNLIEEIELADQVGLEVFGVGEHHRRDYAVSSPSTVLAYAAARTANIRLSSAVTVLSSEEPVRVFEQFATIDQLSRGRAEIMVGRGSFIESFPLFGYDLNDYNELFAEKLDLLLKIRDNERVTWSGRHRAPLQDQAIYPRPCQDKLPIGVAVGGTPQSAVRAGMLALPMTLAIIGGQPERFVPFAEIYREAGTQAGHDRASLHLAINTHGHVADSMEQAIEDTFAAYKGMMDQIGRERGWPPMTREQFEAGTGLHGHLMMGSPEQVIEKILHQYELFHHQRYLIHFGIGAVEHEKVMHAIELFGAKVAPAIREEVAHREASVTP
ncbi:MAG TPA: LLM class flavin-dependent oxidoreductase [Thermomicrobiales bacterium]|nr:LLM class flavin-dependent oxidoreductase [Thermomicrobiales bacterium]